MRSEENTILSSLGAARRDAILQDLTEAMARRQQIRRVRKHARWFACLALLVGGLACLLTFSLNSPLPIQPLAIRQSPRLAPSTQPASSILRIETDAAVIGRMQMTDSFSTLRIDDDNLLQILAEIDRPSGIVRIDGHVWLTRAVTDDNQKPASTDPNSS